MVRRLVGLFRRDAGLGLDLPLYDSLVYAASRALPKACALDYTVKPTGSASQCSPGAADCHSFDNFHVKSTAESLISSPSTPDLSLHGSDSSDSESLATPSLSSLADENAHSFFSPHLPSRKSSLATLGPDNALGLMMMMMAPNSRRDSIAGESFYSAVEHHPISRVAVPPFVFQDDDDIYSLDAQERCRVYKDSLAELSSPSVSSSKWWFAKAEIDEEEVVIGRASRATMAPAAPRRVPVPQT